MKRAILFLVLSLFVIKALVANDLEPTPGISIEKIHTPIEGKKGYKINIAYHPCAKGFLIFKAYEDLIAPEIVLICGQKTNLRVSTSYLSGAFTFSKKENDLSILATTQSWDMDGREEKGKEPLDKEIFNQTGCKSYYREWKATAVGELVLNFSLMIEDDFYLGFLFPETLKIPIKVIEKESEGPYFSRAPSIGAY